MRTTLRSLALVSLVVLLGAAGCQEKEQAAAPAPAAPQAQPQAAAAKSSIPEALLHPATATDKAPEKYRARFTTTKGDFVIEVYRDWAPLGADRFYNLVRRGFYDNISVFRMIPGFVAQWGIHGEPEVNTAWRGARIQDDPAGKQTNARGTVTFAMGGPNTRTTHVFVNLQSNQVLDGMGFAPIGKVVEGLSTIESFYGGYGDGPPQGNGPDQGRSNTEGNSYLQREFPRLDFIKAAKIE